MAESGEVLIFPTRTAWRDWLAQNHATVDQAWVALYKKAAAHKGLTYDEGVEEALCFGWIDGVTHGLDEEKFAQRYSPRKPGSVWSLSNIERVERLIASGQMTEAGMELVREAQAGGAWELARRREQVDLIPPDLQAALEQHPGAVEAYLALSASRRKQLLHLLFSAKQAATRARRVTAIVSEVSGEQ